MNTPCSSTCMFVLKLRLLDVNNRVPRLILGEDPDRVHPLPRRRVPDPREKQDARRQGSAPARTRSPFRRQLPIIRMVPERLSNEGRATRPRLSHPAAPLRAIPGPGATHSIIFRVGASCRDSSGPCPSEAFASRGRFPTGRGSRNHRWTSSRTTALRLLLFAPFPRAWTR